MRDGPVWRSSGGGFRSRGYSVFAFLGFLSSTLLIARNKFGLFSWISTHTVSLGIFFFLNRINLINGLVQTFGLKQVVIWAYFVLWA